MSAYKLGQNIALKLAVYPDEYNASGMLGALGGGALGAAGGGVVGGTLADHLGQVSRSRILGIPVPGTGLGERMFGSDNNQLLGEIGGAIGGGLLGGSMGYHAGHLKALKRSPPPRVVEDGNIDPMLLQYLMQGSPQNQMPPTPNV